MKKLIFALLSVLVLSNFCTANAAIGTLPELTAVFDKDFTSTVKSGETDYDIDSHGWSTSADDWSDWSGFAVQSGAPLVLHSSSDSDEFKGLTGKNPMAVYRTNTGGSFRVSGKLSSDNADSFSLWFNSRFDADFKTVQSGFRFVYFGSSQTLELRYYDGVSEHTLGTWSEYICYKWLSASFELTYNNGTVKLKLVGVNLLETAAINLETVCLGAGISSHNTDGLFAFTADDAGGKFTCINSLKIELFKTKVTITDASGSADTAVVSARWTSPQSVKPTAVCAVYDSTGMMVGSEVKTASEIGNSGTFDFNVSNIHPGAPATVKVFLCGSSDGLMPLCNAAEYELSGGVQ